MKDLLSKEHRQHLHTTKKKQYLTHFYRQISIWITPFFQKNFILYNYIHNCKYSK